MTDIQFPQRTTETQDSALPVLLLGLLAAGLCIWALAFYGAYQLLS